MDSRRRKALIITGSGLGLLFVGLGIWVGPVIISAKRAGLLDSIEAEKYTPSREANLRAIYVALNLYHDSEGQFPAANGWMDAIQPRLQRNGLSKSEAQQKLVRPDLAGQDGKYGYALNGEVATKYRDDLKSKEVPLVAESLDTKRNALTNGTPDPTFWYVTVSGKIVKSSKLP